jgi:hypothetical protein
MKEPKKTNLQIRGVSPELVAKVRERADKKNQTMSQYLIDLIRKETEHLSLEEWLDLVRRQPPTPVRGIITAAQAVREAREERAEHLANIFRERDRARKARA